GRLLETCPARRNRGLVIATRRFRPSGSKPPVGLQSRVADVLPDSIRSRGLRQGALEVSAEQVVDRQVEVRHPEPPPLIGMWAQQSDRLSTVREPLLRPSGPVALERQQAVRLSQGRFVAGRRRRLDRSARAVGGPALI